MAPQKSFSSPPKKSNKIPVGKTKNKLISAGYFHSKKNYT
jgi:hypothetical protein